MNPLKRIIEYFYSPKEKVREREPTLYVGAPSVEDMNRLYSELEKELEVKE